MKWLSPSTPRVLRRWKALPPNGDGTLDLPSWLAYACATAETSAQTSATTARTGFAENAPRAFSRDGSTWGLLLEPATTNLIREQDLANWGGAAGVNAATGPDGNSSTCGSDDASAAAIETSTYVTTGTVASTDVYSGWVYNETEPTNDARIDMSPGGSIGVTGAGVWGHYQAMTAVGSTNPTMVLTPRNTTVSDTGQSRFWGLQLEAHAYATSFIGTDKVTFIRGAGTLSLPTPADVFPGGYYDIEFVIRPLFASSEDSTNWFLLFLDAALGAADHVQMVGDRVRITVDDTNVVESGVLTWSRHQELRIRVRHAPSGASIEMTGATTGDGAWTAAAQPATALPSTAYLLGGSGGATEGFALDDITFREAA
jgi:hypothetical protein